MKWKKAKKIIKDCQRNQSCIGCKYPNKCIHGSPLIWTKENYGWK